MVFVPAVGLCMFLLFCLPCYAHRPEQSCFFVVLFAGYDSKYTFGLYELLISFGMENQMLLLMFLLEGMCAG